MQKILSVATLIVASFFTNTTFAQTAEEVVERYRKAVARWMHVASVPPFQAKGEICTAGMCMPLMLYVGPDKQMRLDLSVQGMTFQMIRNDSLSWEYNPIEKTSKIHRAGTGEPFKKDNTFDYFNRTLLDYRDNGLRLEMKERVTIDGEEMFVLSTYREDATTSTTYYISTQTHFIRKIEDQKSTRWFGNYFQNNELLFPLYSVEKSPDREVTMRLSVLDTDTPLADDLFIIPDWAFNTTTTRLYIQAKEFEKEERYDQAVNLYNEILKKDGGSENLYNLRGLAFFEGGNYYEAIADFTQAMSYNGSNPVLFHNRALAKSYLGDAHNALRDYEKALSINPDFLATFELRGLLYFQNEHYEEARSDFSRVIELAPDKAVAYFNRGVALAQLEKFNEALADYTKAAAKGYATAHFHNYYGVAWYQLENYDSAKIWFSYALKQEPDNILYLENLARALYNTGDYEDAEAFFVKAIAHNEDSAEMYNMMGLCRYRLEEYAGAIRYFTRAIDLNPEQALYYDNRAAACEEIEDYDGAITDYTESLSRYPNDPDIYYKRGLLKIHTSQKIEGCMDLGTANEMKHEPAREAIIKHCN